MAKKDKIIIFIDELYSKPPKRNYPTNKIKHNYIDGIWSMDLADKVDYKILSIKGFRYIFVKIDNFSRNLWAMPFKKYIVKQ